MIFVGFSMFFGSANSKQSWFFMHDLAHEDHIWGEIYVNDMTVILIA